MERVNMNDDDDDNNNNNKAESLAELIVSLEEATLMAKQLPNTTDPSYLLHIYSFLHQANHRLSSFLSSDTHLPPDNSLSSSDDPMQEENSNNSVDRVEERMRDCFIKNKRPKRPLSPSSMAVAEEKRLHQHGGVNGFDPHATKLRALDLVYQFHS